MLAASAPYIVTILVSFSSWFLLTFHAQFSDYRVLRYFVVEESAEGKIIERKYRISNISPVLSVSGRLSIRCTDAERGCFDGAPIREIVPPWSGIELPMIADGVITQAVYLPSGASFDLTVREVSGDHIHVFLFIPDNINESAILSKDEVWSVWIARNFIEIAFIIWIVGIFLLLSIYIILPTRTNKSPDNKNYSSEFLILCGLLVALAAFIPRRGK